MTQNVFKKILPYLVAIIVFIAISLIYFSPVLQGKKLMQSDIVNYQGSAKEVTDFRNVSGEEPLWTNSMFGGMPAYQISTYFKSNFVPFFNNIFKLYLPHPANILFVLLLGFFILLLSLKIDPWLAIVGAIAFAFSSYFFIILEVGHNAKTLAIAYMPAVLGSLILVFKKKYILGGAMLLLFMALEITVNHVQMTYYLLLLLAIYGISELVVAIIKKQYAHFLKSAGIAIIAMILAVGPNIANLWTSYEYMQETIRGGTELTSEQNNRTSGLDKDYITQWSYGIGESFSLMIPDVKGGATGALGEDKFCLENVDRNYRQGIAQQNHYWGNMPFTSGPVYAGAFIVFLFVLGLFIVKGNLKWTLLIATILSLFLSWGHNFMWFTNIFLDYLPMYNKFRAVSSILVIAELAIPLLAILALKEICENPQWLTEKKNRTFFYISLAATGGLTLIFWLLPDTFFSFISSAEANQFSQYKMSNPNSGIDEFVSNLEIARISIFKASAIRSFLFIILGAALIFIYSKMKKMSKYIVYVLAGLLIIIDMGIINKRYLNDKDFKSAKQVDNPIPMSKADQFILEDKNLDFRVLNLAVGNFTTDAATSYYHKSIGGYHAAKLRRYQELIEHRLFHEHTRLVNVLQSSVSDSIRIATMYGLTSLNMLNTKYYIYNPDATPLRNPAALGNAWFVQKVKTVENADEELQALNNFIPATTAIVDKRFENLLKDFHEKYTPGSTITLTSYQPNYLVYETKGVKENQLAVFSEIYYDKGWNAYIDGQEANHFRANYVLRAMIIPPGDHKIEFRFEPKSFIAGSQISLISSIILILVIAGAIFYEIYKSRNKKEKPAEND